MFKKIKIIVGICLLLFLISKIKFSYIAASFSWETLPYLLLSFVFLAVSIIFIQGIRIFILFEKYGFNLLTSLKLSFLGSFFNNLFPGSLGGDFYKISFLKNKINVDISSVLTFFFVNRVIGLLSVCILTLLYFVFNITVFKRFFFEQNINLNIRLEFVITGLILLTLILLFGFIKSEKYRNFVKKCKKSLYLIPLKNYLSVLLFSIFQHIYNLIGFCLLSIFFGIHTDVWNFMLVVFTAAIISALPITMGSIGFREGAVVIALMFFGAELPQASSVAVTNRLFISILSITGGIMFLKLSDNRNKKDINDLKY